MSSPSAADNQSAGLSAARSGASLPETGFLRQPQVLLLIPISKSTLWRRVQAGTFPKPVKLSVRATAWRAEDVRGWIGRNGSSQLESDEQVAKATPPKPTRTA